jgi:hypothetical protein
MRSCCSVLMVKDHSCVLSARRRSVESHRPRTLRGSGATETETSADELFVTRRRF